MPHRIKLPGALLLAIAITTAACSGGHADEVLLVVPDWDDADVLNLCVTSTETYEQVDGAETPFYDALTAAITAAVSNEEIPDWVLMPVLNGAECDATLSLDVVGTAEAGNTPDGMFYTGIDVAGTITLSSAGRADVTQTFSYQSDPIDQIPLGVEPPNTPLEAFEYVSTTDWCRTVAGMFLYKYPGTEIFDC